MIGITLCCGGALDASSLLEVLELADGKWRAVLQEPYVVASEPCSLEIHTVYSYDMHVAAPQPNQEELHLCLFILSNFDRVRDQAVDKFVEYCKSADPDPAKHIRNPTIDVGRQTFEEDG